MISRKDVLLKTRKNMSRIREFGVKRMALFGSVARNESTEKSDIDFLVEFYSTPSFDSFMDLRFFLEDIFQTKVDLLTKKGIRKELLSLIEREAIDVETV